MENSNSLQLSLNSKGLCFLCLKDKDIINDCESSDPDDSLQNDFKVTSFRYISRFLKINNQNIVNLCAQTHSSSLDKKWDVMVPLCQDCFIVAERFNELFKTLELTKLHINYCVRKIHKLMVNAEKDTGLVEQKIKRMNTGNEDGLEIENTGLMFSHASLMENMRTVLMDKCAERIKTEPPRVKVARKENSIKGDSRSKFSLEIFKMPPVVTVNGGGNDFRFNNVQEEIEEPLEPESALVNPNFDDHSLTVQQNLCKTCGKQKSSSSSSYCLKCAFDRRRTHVQRSCTYCRYVITTERTGLKRHIVRFHCDHYFLDVKDPSVTEDQFKLIINYLLFDDIKTTPYVNVFKGTNGTGGYISQCQYCDEKFVSTDSIMYLKIHLIEKHYEVLVQKLRNLQEDPDTNEKIALLASKSEGKLCSCGSFLSNRRSIHPHLKNCFNYVGNDHPQAELPLTPSSSSPSDTRSSNSVTKIYRRRPKPSNGVPCFRCGEVFHFASLLRHQRSYCKKNPSVPSSGDPLPTMPSPITHMPVIKRKCSGCGKLLRISAIPGHKRRCSKLKLQQSDSDSTPKTLVENKTRRNNKTPRPASSVRCDGCGEMFHFASLKRHQEKICKGPLPAGDIGPIRRPVQKCIGCGNSFCLDYFQKHESICSALNKNGSINASSFSLNRKINKKKKTNLTIMEQRKRKQVNEGVKRKLTLENSVRCDGCSKMFHFASLRRHQQTICKGALPNSDYGATPFPVQKCNGCRKSFSLRYFYKHKYVCPGLDLKKVKLRFKTPSPANSVRCQGCSEFFHYASLKRHQKTSCSKTAFSSNNISSSSSGQLDLLTSFASQPQPVLTYKTEMTSDFHICKDCGLCFDSQNTSQDHNCQHQNYFDQSHEDASSSSQRQTSNYDMIEDVDASAAEEVLVKLEEEPNSSETFLGF